VAITTTSSITEKQLRCQCGKLARGGVLLGGKSECCVSKSDAPLLATMLGDAPPAVEASPAGELSLAFALGFADPSNHRATITAAPRPSVPLVNDYVDAVDGDEVERPARRTPEGTLAEPSIAPWWEGGRPIQTRRGRIFES
jgi:hypothetical protein